MGGPRSSDLVGYAGATLNNPCLIHATPRGGQPRHVGAKPRQRGIETGAWAFSDGPGRLASLFRPWGASELPGVLGCSI